MRRIIATIAAAALTIALSACEPPTVTATPSTLRPGCTEVTTVTGTTAPKDALKNVLIESQGSDGRWATWRWFPTGANGESRQEIRGTVPSSGNYTITYYRPQPGTATIRLRVRAMKLLSEEGVVSKSWYATPPRGC